MSLFQTGATTAVAQEITGTYEVMCTRASIPRHGSANPPLRPSSTPDHVEASRPSSATPAGTPAPPTGDATGSRSPPPVTETLSPPLIVTKKDALAPRPKQPSSNSDRAPGDHR